MGIYKIRHGEGGGAAETLVEFLGAHGWLKPASIIFFAIYFSLA